MEQNFALESGSHRLYMKLKDIVDDDVVKEDESLAKGFTIFANQLVSLFNCISGQPFWIELHEVKYGEDDTYAVVEITSIDEDGNDAFDLDEAGTTHVIRRQSYLAQHLNTTDKSCIGTLTVSVKMPHPAGSDGDALPVENPLAAILVDLTYMQYYRTTSQEFKDRRTEYIDAPVPPAQW